MAKVPKQCQGCLNFHDDDQVCSIYEQLPGEYGRETITTCPTHLNKDGGSDELKALVEYIDKEENSALSDGILKLVDKVLMGYTDKFKIIVVGMARRKIKSMVNMVDITDKLIEKLADDVALDQVTPNQAIRLLSELNMSVNNDLSFVMKLINPDTQLKDLQTYVDARSINISTGASPKTEKLADEILALTPTSRDKIRGAFDALLNSISPDTYEEVDLTRDASTFEE